MLDEAPLIVAAGADVERRMTLALGAGAVAALRETVVLGRDGERPGTLVSSPARRRSTGARCCTTGCACATATRTSRSRPVIGC